ncbi:MAG: DUF362 domain-containing protein [Phycisphaerae bacterium]|nr:DUF362 domain-containing protein [Phycisphaerae bacterium]
MRRSSYSNGIPPLRLTRREFVRQLPLAAAAAGSFLGCHQSGGAPIPKPPPGKSRVIVARNDKLTHGDARQHLDLLVKILDAGIMRLTDLPTPEQAWSALFRPEDVVGIKVNTLGRSTHPVVADALAAGLRKAGLPAENIVIWDRFDAELHAAGYRLNKSASGVGCYGTDAGPDARGAGYEQTVETSGEIGSCFSQIVTRKVTALISAGVLKHHDLAGLSGSLKNFYGAIHNPNKYHDDNCSPYVADVVRSRHIAPKLRLAVMDGIEAQYHAGPAKHPAFTWNYAGLLLSRDLVAIDRVSAEIIDQKRIEKGKKPLAKDGRPITHVFAAADRGLGVADLAKIDRIEL